MLVEHDPAVTIAAIVSWLEESTPIEAAAQPDDRLSRSGPRRPRLLDEPPLESDAIFRSRGEDILELLRSGADGLSANEARRRLAVYGPNRTPPPLGRSQRDMVAAQFTGLPVALLFGSAVLSFATGGLLDAALTIGVVLANAAIGFSSENATERLIRRLSRPTEHMAEVQRDGNRLEVLAATIVPGDILVLAPGQFVPADARILECRDLTVDESTLTGESLPVRKHAKVLDQAPVAVADRHNIVHDGTIVSGGDGRAVVFRTGSGTEAARTRALIDLARPPRPVIEEELSSLSGRLALLCVGASSVVFLVGLLRGEPLLAMARSAVALAVAAIPEGLPAIATTTLALGARAMEREQAFVRALPAVEALGTIDTICLDKTGTLTENRMAVVGVAIGEEVRRTSADGHSDGLAPDLLRAIAEALALCNEANLAMQTGSSTELALLRFCSDTGIDPDAVQQQSPIVRLQSRDQAHRWMATAHRLNGADYVAVKGAPDELLALAAHELTEDGLRPLDEERRRRILATNETLAREGLRVLGVARKEGDLRDGLPDGLVWLGLVALADPVRAEAQEAVEIFHRAGIRTIIITGDQPATALSVAEAVAVSRTGIIPVVDGANLADLDDQALGALALRTSVFARVSPGDKLRIVRALQGAGRRVAMIGDGVNDGPALRAAAVGVAMGRQGTDVAREVADIVIADDDLRALARAIARGRATDDSIGAATRYFLSTNLSEVLLMLGETLHGRGGLETPMELFWLNLVTDIMPGLGLAMAEPRGDVMTRPPRAADAPLFGHNELRDLGFDGAHLAASALAAHLILLARKGAGPQARAATFITLSLAQFAHAWGLRDRTPGSVAGRVVSETRLGGALAAACGLLAAPFLIRPLRTLLGLGVPGPGDLALSAGLAATSFGVGELRRTQRMNVRSGRAIVRVAA
ncbi:Calcium-transporting ATPase 1 [Sphingobium sp. AntQ-1]|nr:Calcium-transporting ATPase 1 [Sphingobium sp. AntQ-1]